MLCIALGHSIASSSRLPARPEWSSCSREYIPTMPGRRCDASGAQGLACAFQRSPTRRASSQQLGTAAPGALACGTAPASINPPSRHQPPPSSPFSSGALTRAPDYTPQVPSQPLSRTSARLCPQARAAARCTTRACGPCARSGACTCARRQRDNSRSYAAAPGSLLAHPPGGLQWEPWVVPPGAWLCRSRGCRGSIAAARARSV